MLSADPRLGIVMITHNRRAQVLQTLAELTRLPDTPRIVVADNDSTDGTAAAIAQSFPHVDVIEADRNLGAAGRTLGVRHLDVPYIAFSDDDTWWAPGSLRRATDLFDY